MNGPIASVRLNRDGGRTDEHGCYAQASSVRGASMKSFTREPSWWGTVPLGRSLSAPALKILIEVAEPGGRADCEDSADISQHFDSNFCGASVHVVVQTQPPNKAMQATVRVVTARADARVAPTQPAPDRQR